MALPTLTDEQRKQALAKAAQARRLRADLKERLKKSEMSLREVLAKASDDIVGKMKVSSVLESLPGFDDEPAAEEHPTPLALGEDRACPGGDAHGEPEDDGPNGGRDHHVHGRVPGSDLLGQRHRRLRPLQDPGFLHVPVGVSSRRQLEVAGAHGPMALEQRRHLVRRHAAPASRRIASAAAAGSVAWVTGRPTTT